MYTLINGSPKIKDSNSLYFLKLIARNIDNYQIYNLKNNNFDQLISSIKKSSVIVFSFPLYVDSPPSIALNLLDEIIDSNLKLFNKKVYCIINCGFREGQQNITAINIIKQWCKKTGAIYSGGILIGAGEIIGKEKYKFVSHKALNKIKKFAKIIQLQDKTEDIITTMDFFNNSVYCFLANMSFKKTGKKNNLSDSDLRKE